MLASKLRLTLATAAVLGAAAGCSQNPQFRMTLADQAYGALESLYVLLAEADLGALAAPSSFRDQGGTYAEIIGGFEAGRLLVAGRPQAAAPDSLNASIDGCVGQIRAMAAQHRSAGVAPGAAVLGAVRASCDAAARQVAAEEVSSWLFSTAAGDL